MRIEGRIIVSIYTKNYFSLSLEFGRYLVCFIHLKGFDEYMNLVLDDACEVHLKKNTRTPLGRILLKGDNITLIQQVVEKEVAAK